MKQNILLDTGPLVASINKKDRFFDWAKKHFESFKPPLLTCEPVRNFNTMQYLNERRLKE